MTMRENDTLGDAMMTPVRSGGVIVDTGGDPAALRPRDARDVREAVIGAAASGERLRIRAGGSWLQAGRPTVTDRVLDISALTGIIDYVPGDLTLTGGKFVTYEGIEVIEGPVNPTLTRGFLFGLAEAIGHVGFKVH